MRSAVKTPKSWSRASGSAPVASHARPSSADELLVVVGFAEEVDVLAEDLLDDLGSVSGGDEVPQAREDDPVHE